MNAPHPVHETPKQRLARVDLSSPPVRGERFGPNYLIAVALLLLLGILVVVGAIGGMLGYEVMAGYARRILEWTGAK